MADDQHYDVIVIGTGAGGGTLAHRLAPSGKRVLLLERGDYLPRERDNWDSTAVFVTRQVPRAGVLVRPARRRVPAGGQLLRRRQHQVLRRGAVPAAAGGLRRDPPPRRHLAGLADRLRRPRAVLHRRPSTSTWSTAGTARTRPRGRPARQYRFPPVRARAADPAAERRPGEAGPAPVPPADRRQPHPGRAGPGDPRQRLHPLRPGRRVPLPGQRQVRRPGDLRRPGAGARQRRAGHQRPRAAAGDRRRPAARSPGRHRARRRARPSRFSADIVVVACGAVNSAVLLLRSANDKHPHGLANSSDVVGRHYMRHNNLALMAVSKEPNPTRFQKTLALQRLVPRARTTGTTRSAASRCSASPTPSRSAAARRAGPARSRRRCRSRCSPTTPSTSGCAARTCRCRTTGSPLGPRRQHPPGPRREEQHRGLQAAAAQAAGHARRPGHAPAPPARPQHLPAQGHADRRHRAPGRHGPVRHRPGELRARRQLQGPRPGQPLRRRHQLLPEHRRGEPVADRHRQRAAGRRPHRRASSR